MKKAFNNEINTNIRHKTKVNRPQYLKNAIPTTLLQEYLPFLLDSVAQFNKPKWYVPQFI